MGNANTSSSSSHTGSGGSTAAPGARPNRHSAAGDNKTTAATTSAGQARWSFVRGTPPMELLELPSTAPKKFHTRSTVPVLDPNAATNVFPCFRGGLLFRIVDARDKSWHFYNDTSDMEMHVEYHFGPGSRVEVTRHVDYCGPSPLPGTDGWIVVYMTIFPGETLRFIGKSQTNGFRSVFRIAPLSDKVAQRQADVINAAVARLQDEMEVVAKLTAEMDCPTEEQVVERCARQRVPFVDLGFRPMAESLFGQLAGALGRKYLRPTKGATWTTHSLAQRKSSKNAMAMNSLGAANAMATGNLPQLRGVSPRTDTPVSAASSPVDASGVYEKTVAGSGAASAGGGGGGGGVGGAVTGMGDAVAGLVGADGFHDKYEGDARDLHRRLPPVVWLRPTQYLPPGSAISCVGRGVSVYDIEQGFLGDTWLLSAIAIVAQSPGVVEFIFRDSLRPHRPEQQVGAYRVCFNIDGWWTTLVLDDYVPCIGNKPAFASNRAEPQNLWPSLLQKAFAKVYGSYAAVCTGDPLLAWRSLTGCPTWRFNTRWRRAIDLGGDVDEEFFDMLLRFLDRGYLICLNTRGVDDTFSHDLSDSNQEKCQELLTQYESVGLAMGMSYAVLDCKYFPQWKLFLFKIRNPWNSSGGAGQDDDDEDGSGSAPAPAAAQQQNQGQWNGNWSLNSEMWRRFPDVAEACGKRGARAAVDPEEESGNTFWMSWEDCLRFFDGGGVCFWQEPLSRVIDHRVMGHFIDSLSNVCVELHVHRKSTLTVVLSQNDSAGRDSIGAMSAMMLCVAAPIESGSSSDEKENKDSSGNGGGGGGGGYASSGKKSKDHHLYMVKWNSTTDPMNPSDEFVFTTARDVGIVLELEPRNRPYLVVPRVFDAGVNRPFVLAFQSQALAGSEQAGYDAKFVHISAQSDFFLNRRVVAHPRRAMSVPAKASFQIKTGQGVLEGLATSFDVKNAEPDDAARQQHQHHHHHHQDHQQNDSEVFGAGGLKHFGSNVAAAAAAAVADSKKHADGKINHHHHHAPDSPLDDHKRIDVVGGDSPSVSLMDVHGAAGKNQEGSSGAFSGTAAPGPRRKFEEL